VRARAHKGRTYLQVYRGPQFCRYVLERSNFEFVLRMAETVLFIVYSSNNNCSSAKRLSETNDCKDGMCLELKLFLL
jgi:hypothetical protein